MKAQIPHIVIERVANGYLVTLPAIGENPMIEAQKEIIDHAMKSQRDPLLSGLNEDEVKETEIFPQTENVFIFQEFEQVLAFLSKRFLA